MPGTTPRGYLFPLYTEANDFPDDMEDFATAVDADVQANLVTAVNNGLNAPSARASSTVVQSVPNNTDTTMTFLNEEYDNANIFTVGVSNTNFVIPSTGLYMISCAIVYALDAAGTTDGRTIIVKVNGNFVYAKTLAAPTYDVVQIPMTNLQALTAGNIVTVAARQNSGGAINVTDKRISINRMTI